MKPLFDRRSKAAAANRRRPHARRAARRTTPLRVEHLERRNLLAALPPADLVSWYRAEGDASDFAGGNDGTLLNGATFTAGKVGQAFAFDGVDDQVSVPDSADQNPGSQFTVEAWVNPSSSGHGRPVAQKRSSGNVGGYTFETTHAPFAPNDGLQFIAWIGGAQHLLQTPASVLTNGAWQHVAATYDGTALRIFVDGAEKASTSASGAMDNSTEPVVIGQNVVIPSFAWHGAIDEVSFYSRALSQAEIQSVVDAGSEGKQAAIVVNTAADTIDTDPGVTSLREAILQSNASVGVLDTISFNIPRPFTDGLVSGYSGEGNANDIQGDNHGTLQNGVTFAAGHVGQAFSFDGVDDSVDLGNWFNLQTFTIDMWVKPGASQTAYANIIDNNHTDFRGWVIQQNASNLNQYVWGVHDGSTTSPILNLTADVWQHIAVTHDGASRVNNAYVNGSLVGSITGTGNIVYDSTQFLRLASWGGGGRNWNGELDEVRIFDRALSAAEVQAIATEVPAIASGPRTISLTSELPPITDPVIIDGYTQPGASPNTLADGNNAVILVELMGGEGSIQGLSIWGGGSVVRGLAINRFSGSGIELRSSDNVIEGNFIGTDVTGTQDLGNHEGVTIIGAAEIEPFYSNDFESGVGEEWNTGDTDETPADDSEFLGQFLGQFGSETVTLTLNADAIDQDTTVITVAFDLFVIRTWDGNHDVTGSGPDRFTLSLGDGTTLLDTTFSNGHPNSAAAGQAYPGVFGTGQFDSRTGAAENNTLGFTFPGGDVMDSVYHLSFTFPYTGGDLVLNFTGALTSSIDDESWGLNNVKLFAGEVGQAVEGNTIGGTSPEEQNIVAFSGGDGIRTTGENIEVAIVGNSIFANGAAGIDLDDENVDPPVILSLTSFPGELAISGSLDAEVDTRYRIEFFANDSPDASGFGEGQRLLGVRQVTIGSSGQIAFIHELPPVADGQWITATATLVDGDGETLLETSEFSQAIPVVADTVADLSVTITDSPDPIFVGEALTYTITVTNHGPGDATGVVVTDTGSPGGVFGSATLPVGDLPNGASRSFQIVIYPGAAGTITNTAVVTANEADSESANNTFTASTLVERVPLPKIELAQAQYEVREGEAFAVLTVRRTGNLTQGATVDFTTVDGTAGQRGLREGLTRIDDFTTTSGTLVFRSRSNVATIRVPIRNDGAVEPDETFRVVLSNPSAGNELGAIASAVVTIHDNDPTVFFVAGSMERSEANISRTTIEVRLQPASNQTVTVVYAFVGGNATPTADFRLTGSRTLTFRPGETSKFVNLTLVNDTLFEGNETAIFELSSPMNAFLGGQSRHRVTIVDNDPQPPPVEPGSTPDTALFIDLQTLPRQSYREILVGNIDKDVYRVHLGAGERLALDVDPQPIGDGQIVIIPGLATSTLVVLAPDKVTELARVGRSAEPDTGVATDNAATLFQATTAGDYYIRLEKATTAIGSYRLWFHLLGVSENVPAPELLNAAGAMFAWFEPSTTPGIATVGITGPTGYGFTLEGAWQRQITSSTRSTLKSQTLTLPVGSQFTLLSPQGVALPLIANGPIVIATKAQRWGDFLGEVTTTAINFPVALGIAPINDLLADVFGSEIAAVGLLSGNWRISLGGKVLAVSGKNTISDIQPLLAGVPYLRQKGPININAQLGPISLNYAVVKKPIDWAFDPGDPMLYLKAEELGAAKQPSLAISLHGLLEYKPQDAPSPLVDAGVTQFFGHVYGSATIPFKVGPIPLEVDAEVVINVDADRDGRPLGDLRDVDELFDVLEGDFSEVREILNDVQIGANGILDLVVIEDEFNVELGRASVVLNGLTETIWVRGQQGGTNPLAGTPLAQFNTGNTIVLEGMIDWDGDFLLSTTTTYDLGPAVFTYNITIRDEGISARVTGKAEWSAKFNYGLGTVNGKAIAEIEANIDIEFDENGVPHFSGSLSARGRLRFEGEDIFDGSIPASVRSKGFRFRFPRGVGNIDLNIL